MTPPSGELAGVVLDEPPAPVLNYNHLYYFHRVADAGSIAQAAEQLGVTQPTVSEQVKQLERTLGVSLFQRIPGGLRLTEAGQRAYEHTTVMFRASERLVEELGHVPTDLPRFLRVGISTGASRSIATDYLMPVFAIDDFTPSIRSGDLGDLLRDLRGNELDLVLCETEPMAASRTDLEMAHLEHTTLVAVAPPEVAPADDWSNVKIVQYRATSGYRWDVEAYLGDHGLCPQVAGETDDALLMLETAMRGGFVAFVPRGVARDAVAAGRLQVLAKIEVQNAGLYALHQDGAAASLARRAVELLAAHAQAARDG